MSLAKPSPTFALDGAVRPGNTLRPDDPPLPPLTGLGRLADAYTLQNTLGTGGTAIVRLARQHALDRPVAVKSPLGGSVDAAARVLQEAWVTGALEHPGVVPVHDVALDEAGCPHIVMRRIAGWTWTELIGDPEAVHARFGATDVLGWHLRVLMSVAATVHHAHERGVMHRDLKPDNVMIGPTGEAYVLDWGIAAALDERTAHYLPRAGDLHGLAGTPCFMAPEMVLGGELGTHTDVYLLGGLLHAVLTGEAPHPGDDVNAVLAGIPAFAPSFPADIPSRLADLARAALATDPEARPASAEAFRRAVQAWLEERDTDALVAAGEQNLAAFRQAAEEGERAIARYAAARSSFEQALARSPRNGAAKAGLARLTEAVVRWELGRGRTAAAELALAEMAEPPEELARDVERARKADEARAEQASAMLRDRDPSVGIRTRAFVIANLGAVFTAVPLYAAWRGLEPGLGLVAVGSAVTLAFALGLWAWARDSLSRSALNRAVIRTVVTALSAQLAIVATAYATGMPALQALTMFPLVWGALAGGLAFTVEPALGLVSLGFFGAFVVAVAAPAYIWEGFVASNAWLVLVCVGRWGQEARASWRELRRQKDQSP